MVSSNFGFIFSPDHANVAAELSRVPRPGGRLGFTAWKPNPKLGDLYRRFTEVPIEGREVYEWGREDHVEDMLGEDFELEFVDGTLWLEADDGEELWEVFSQSAPPVVSLLARLNDEDSEEFHRAFVELYDELSHRGRRHSRAAPVPARARPAQRERVVTSLLQELIRVDTVQPARQRDAAAELLRAYLEAARHRVRALRAARPSARTSSPGCAAAATGPRSRCCRTPTSFSPTRASGAPTRSPATSSTARSGGAAPST